MSHTVYRCMISEKSLHISNSQNLQLMTFHMITYLSSLTQYVVQNYFKFAFHHFPEADSPDATKTSVQHNLTPQGVKFHFKLNFILAGLLCITA